ncbi:MAG: HD domain-containing protein [Deltaproteobacteria bacterium]|nr:HD domain-containing protein [Deltaproteobacteria bacterium]
MKKAFIKNIREKDQIQDTFLVSKKDAGMSRTGKPYLNLRLMDSTGEMEARVWDDADALSKAFDKDDIVFVKGYAVAYQGGIQLNINDAARVPDGDVSVRDYLPSSKRAPEEMIAELEGIISGMKNPHLKGLLKAIFGDSDVRTRFMTAPAAKGMHHPYLGGLIEHVLSMCGLADRVAGHYGQAIDKDLLITGAILHDIGKIYELSYKRAFDYTDEGRLVGHITIGVELVNDRIKGLKGFPKELGVLLKHMLLSHHGHLEFGSPKRPKTIEAIVLYYLDDLDAKVAAMKSLCGDEKDAGSNWTPYQRLFERPMFRGKVPIYEEEKKEEAGIKKESLPLFGKE